MTHSILLIDDNEEFRLIASSLLLDEGYDVWEAACPKEAFLILKTEKIDLIVCDLHMPFSIGKDRNEYEESFRVGVKTITELAWVFPETPIVALSAAAPSDLNRIAQYLTPVPAYSKPSKTYDLLTIVQKSLAGLEPRGFLQ